MWRILIAMSTLIAMPLPVSAATCLGYGTVSLAGRLAHQTYPGPPDYESVAKGDAPRVIWVLLLDRPLCVIDPNPRYPHAHDELEVQLALTADRYATYQGWVGEQVVVSGKLRPGGARYQKRLVLMAGGIKRAQVPRQRRKKVPG